MENKTVIQSADEILGGFYYDSKNEDGIKMWTEDLVKKAMTEYALQFIDRASIIATVVQGGEAYSIILKLKEELR